MSDILIEAQAEQTLESILARHDDGEQGNTENYPVPYISGYFEDSGRSWTAFDNTTRCCWVENFKTKKEAVAYSTV